MNNLFFTETMSFLQSRYYCPYSEVVIKNETYISIFNLKWETMYFLFPGEGNGKPLQYSCLENPMDSGTWQAIVLRVS